MRFNAVVITLPLLFQSCFGPDPPIFSIIAQACEFCRIPPGALMRDNYHDTPSALALSLVVRCLCASLVPTNPLHATLLQLSRRISSRLWSIARTWRTPNLSLLTLPARLQWRAVSSFTQTVPGCPLASAGGGTARSF